MSIRLRLTLLYSLILAASLIAFSIGLYLTVAHSTRSFMEDTLALEMKKLVENNQQPLLYMKSDENSLVAAETYWQACDSQGNVIGRADNLQDHTLPLSDAGLRQVQSGRAIYEVADVDGVPLLIYSKPVMAEGNDKGILQVARSTAEQQQALQSLQIFLICGGFFMVSLAMVSGWFMAGKSLQSIDQITRVAHLIGTEQDFTRRIEYQGPADEVGRLATTFNHMLTALENAYQQVAQSLQAQRTFIADASHELRTPLTTLRGNLALLQREPPITHEDRKAVLADLVDECERMMRLVKDLLMLARTDYTPVLELDPVPLAPLFAEVERQIIGMDSACHFFVRQLPAVQVKAKRDLLKQILFILLDNALKYTPRDGLVELSAEQQGSAVAISVKDNGMGIDETHLPHIFSRFYRADPSRHGNGYGLGLAIAHALAEKLNGQIKVESAINQGSTFSIMLEAV